MTVHPFLEATEILNEALQEYYPSLGFVLLRFIYACWQAASCDPTGRTDSADSLESEVGAQTHAVRLSCRCECPVPLD